MTLVTTTPILTPAPGRRPTGSGAATWLRRLYETDAVLTATGLLMLAVLPLFVAGLWLDARVITGVPAWLKPAKFAVSTAIYALTLAWVFTRLPAWPRTRRIVSAITAVVFIVEVAVIAAQAWRGTTSHFNVATPADAVLFLIMGIAIMAQTVASVAVAVALWRQPFADRAMGWALRLGMTLTILGASTGGLMVRPTSTQLADAAVTGRLTVSGAHTVGAPDGGPGLPLTGWSTRSGDIRVAHFMGLHALQALPLFAWLIRRRAPRTQGRLVVAAAGAYAGLFAALLGQALAGLPVVTVGG